MDQIAQGMLRTGEAAGSFVAGVNQSQASAESLHHVASELEELAAQYRL
jgi:methyl-accepting chemotaxis protein